MPSTTEFNVEDVTNLLYRSWESLHKGIGTHSIDELLQGLRQVLQTVSHLALAQLILLDERSKITLALLVPPNTSKPSAEERELRRLSREAELIPLGEEIGEETGKEPYKLPPSLLELALVDDRILFGDWQRDVQASRGAGGYLIYDVHPLQNDGSAGDSIGHYRLADPVGLTKNQPFQERRGRIAVVGTRWEAVGDLPAMSGVILFLNGDGRLDTIVEQEVQLRLASWVVFYAAFVFQLYALSEASMEEPRRLRDQLSRVGFDQLFSDQVVRPYLDRKARDDEGDPSWLRKSVEKWVTQLMGVESEFVKRRVLRNAASRTRQSAEIGEVLRDVVVDLASSSRDDNEDSIALSAMRHLDALFDGLSQDDLDSYIAKRIMPLLCPSLEDAHTGASSELKEMKLHSALSALEDAYRHADGDVRTAIDELLRLRLQKASGTTTALRERLIASLMVTDKWRPDGAQQKAASEAVVEGLVDLDQAGAKLALANRVFSTLDRSRRLEILVDLYQVVKSESRIVDQLTRIHDRMRAYEQGEGARKRLLTRGDGTPKTELISVLSTKGGVGKSLIALGLTSLAAKSGKVCLVDLDFFGPTVDSLTQPAADGSRISLNEYLWAKILPRLHEDTKNQVFEGRRGWESHFEDLADLDPGELLEGLLLPLSTELHSGSSTMQVVTCSRGADLQELMMPLLLSGEAVRPVQRELKKLVFALHKAGYTYVILDTPAELKELATSAASLSTAYGGKSVFVTTLYQPSLRPLLSSLPLYYSKGENHLVFNRVRPLDQAYVANKETLIDYLLTLQDIDDFLIGYNSSTTLLDRLLQTVPVGIHHVPWEESLEAFLKTPGFSDEAHGRLEQVVEPYLRPILGAE